jgi:hypothetical protein
MKRARIRSDRRTSSWLEGLSASGERSTEATLARSMRLGSAAAVGSFVLLAALLFWLASSAVVHACPGTHVAAATVDADVPCGVDSKGNASAFTIATLSYDVVGTRVVLADLTGLDGAAESSGVPVSFSLGDGVVTVDKAVKLDKSVARNEGRTHVVETLAICN